MQYSWIPENVFPQESLWSLMQKFMAWNCCTPIEMWRCFNRINYDYPTGNKNVLISPAINLFKLKRSLRLSTEQLDMSLLDYYLSNDEILILSANSLRYCQKCLSEGYHSPVQQIYFIEKCPFHDCHLKEVCTECGRAISLNYESGNSSQVFLCKHCKFQFIDRDRLLDNLRNDIRDQAYIETSKWFRKRLLVEKKHKQATPEWIGRGASKARRKARIKLLAGIWCEILDDKAPFTTNIMASKQPTVSHQISQYNDLSSVYLEVMREIMTLVSSHNSCIKKALSLWWPDIYYSKKEDLDCEYAHAFVMWRMFCEGEQRPQRLQANIERAELCCEAIKWFDESEHHSIVLKEILKSLYWECVTLARSWRRHGLLKFDLRYLEGRYLPYWYENGDTGRISVWISREAARDVAH